MQQCRHTEVVKTVRWQGQQAATRVYESQSRKLHIAWETELECGVHRVHSFLENDVSRLWSEACRLQNKKSNQSINQTNKQASKKLRHITLKGSKDREKKISPAYLDREQSSWWAAGGGRNENNLLRLRERRRRHDVHLYIRVRKDAVAACTRVLVVARTGANVGFVPAKVVVEPVDKGARKAKSVR
jgi:uncharacterized protein (DUF885 family)